MEDEEFHSTVSFLNN